ncbi:MAG: ATP-binding protein, partial [Acidobacteriales bacterium]|nr:ATP-binding protein [Terriglobales bacterium]
MKERLQRRKKTTEENKDKPAAAPLQPAYFDEKSPAVDTRAEAVPALREQTHAERATLEEPHSTTTDSEPQAANNRSLIAARSSSAATNPERPRRRRSRGGRGRTRRSQAPPVAQGGDNAPQMGPSIATPPASALFNAGSTAQGTPKGIVALAIGLPGSGKSSWFKRHHITPLSSDLLRALLFDDPTEQRFQDLIFSNLRSMLKARLIARRPLNYVDATNLTPHERQGWIKLAKDYGYDVQAVFFDVPLEVCLERNQRRER